MDSSAGSAGGLLRRTVDGPATGIVSVVAIPGGGGTDAEGMSTQPERTKAAAAIAQVL
ncbi:MAG: hypothetical protein Q7J29_08125 [Stagnimonas sp.]|nr:hypothetical protein [Stagnimonas sp.]